MLWIRMTLADDGWGSNISYELLAIILALVAMSALGQKQTYAPQKAMSALHPIATAKANFRKGPCPLYPRKRTCAVQTGMHLPSVSRTVVKIGLWKFADQSR